MGVKVEHLSGNPPGHNGSAVLREGGNVRAFQMKFAVKFEGFGFTRFWGLRAYKT